MSEKNNTVLDDDFITYMTEIHHLPRLTRNPRHLMLVEGVLARIKDPNRYFAVLVPDYKDNGDGTRSPLNTFTYYMILRVPSNPIHAFIKKGTVKKKDNFPETMEDVASGPRHLMALKFVEITDLEYDEPVF